MTVMELGGGRLTRGVPGALSVDELTSGTLEFLASFTRRGFVFAAEVVFDL